MSVRNDPAYKDVFLDNPTLLGVDSIEGSPIISPVQLKTKANRQLAAMREAPRRSVSPWPDPTYLPGDPLRVLRHGPILIALLPADLPEPATPRAAESHRGEAKPDQPPQREKACPKGKGAGCCSGGKVGSVAEGEDPSRPPPRVGVSHPERNRGA